MRKRTRFIWIVIILLLLGGVSSAYYIWRGVNVPEERKQGEVVVFTVKSGESLGSIAQRLEQEKLIRSSWLLKLFARYSGTQNKFKSGSFQIEPGMDMAAIHDQLVFGKEIHSTVVIPEGWTIRRIARYLDHQGILTEQEFLNAVRDPEILVEYRIPAESLEGYLFPDTYSFPIGYEAEKIVDAMVSNFFRRVEDIYPEYREMSPDEFHEKLIVASIVEKEYRLSEEAPIMASVFYNRLRINIHLQSCATVMYIITEIQNRPHQDRLLNSDLLTDSPYNTYKYLGLPEGPIANPGIVALKAAFYPAETNYFFFVLEDPVKGNHTFTTYLDEHIEAKYNNKHLYRQRP